MIDESPKGLYFSFELLIDICASSQKPMVKLENV